jgi:hypothetical protein
MFDNNPKLKSRFSSDVSNNEGTILNDLKITVKLQRQLEEAEQKIQI